MCAISLAALDLELLFANKRTTSLPGDGESEYILITICYDFFSWTGCMWSIWRSLPTWRRSPYFSWSDFNDSTIIIIILMTSTCRLYVVHLWYSRPRLEGETCVRQNPLHELQRVQEEVWRGAVCEEIQTEENLMGNNGEKHGPKKNLWGAYWYSRQHKKTAGSSLLCGRLTTCRVVNKSLIYSDSSRPFSPILVTLSHFWVTVLFQ